MRIISPVLAPAALALATLLLLGCRSSQRTAKPAPVLNPAYSVDTDAGTVSTLDSPPVSTSSPAAAPVYQSQSGSGRSCH